MEDLDKAKKNIKVAQYMLGFSLFITTAMAIYATSLGNPWFFIDVALIAGALYGITKRVYWVGVALCVYWVFNILMMAAMTTSIITWVVRLWFMYQFVMATNSIKILNETDKSETSV